MYGVWTVDHVKAAERRLIERTGEAVLMRRAAFGVAVHAVGMLEAHTGGAAGRRVVLLVGAGNNGGDALWAGAFLRRRGVAVAAVLLAPDRAHAKGLAALRRAGGRVCDAANHERTDHERVDILLATADLVIDGIVGLSASGGLRRVATELVEQVDCPVLAVDLPSGVEPDTGAANTAHVRAEVTVTFGARKPVHVLGAGALASGDVRLVDIGLGHELGEPDLVLLDAQDVGAAWPVPGPTSDKYTQGVVGVAAGSATYPGAAVLSTSGAVYATAGMVRFAGSAADVVRSRWPEIVATGSVADAGRVQSWVVGPGLGTGSAARDMLRTVLGEGVPVCADADAITMLAGTPALADARDPDTPLVLTPHDGEFARLAGEVGDDRVGAALRAAAKWQAVVLLKGHTTVVAGPDRRVLVNP
ncbi:MAG: bifunctional ADP-dependent NAD(P)H-hydrate dehydratase/NAD(P)H-hydrate epimerase, partial [Sciscionella sp.]